MAKKWEVQPLERDNYAAWWLGPPRGNYDFRVEAPAPRPWPDPMGVHNTPERMAAYWRNRAEIDADRLARGLRTDEV